MELLTRNADVAGVIDATLYRLDAMTDKQALALLQKRISRKIKAHEQKEVEDLAEAVGYLPLALELAAAQVIDGISFSELIENLQLEIARLEVLDLPGFEEATNEIIRKKLSLLASFNLSLRKLSKEKLQEFAWLGILPEDVTFTQKMVTTLWEIDSWEARDTLRYLRNKALLLEDIPLADGTPTYRLHDLVHDVSRRILTSPVKPKLEEDLPGLGLTLQDAHLKLLDRYWQCTKDGLWHQVPDDGYVHSYLTWHMEQAACGEELHKLLKEETAEGQNGWYQARERLDQITGYLADVTRAWKLGEEMFKKHQSSNAISLQVRYALITASLNSLADNISPELLGTLVKQKIWTVEQGLAYARQKTQPIQKSLALASLAPMLPVSDIGKTFQEALKIFSERRGYLYGRESERLKLEKVVIDGYACIFTNIAPNITEPILYEALEIIKAFKTNHKVLGMVVLMPYLSALQLEIITKEVERIILELLEQHKRFILSPKNKKAKFPYDLEEVKEFIAYIPEQINKILLQEIEKELLDEIRNRNEPGTYFHISSNKLERLLSPFVAESQLQEAVEQIQRELLYKVGDGNKPGTYFHVSSNKLERLLSPFVAESQLQEAVKQTIIEIKHLIWYGYLCDFVSYLTNIDQRNILMENTVAESVKNKSQIQKALIEARLLKDRANRLELLVEIAPHLSLSLLKEVLKTLQTVLNKDEHVELFVSLASHLPDSLIHDALIVIQSIGNENSRAIALAALIPRLPDYLLDTALVTARKIKEEENREKVLVKLISQVSNSLRNSLLEETLRTLQIRCEKQWQKEREKPNKEENRIKNIDELQVEAMVHLSLSIPEYLKENILSRATDIANKIEYNVAKKVAVRQLILHLSYSQLEELLPTVRELEDENLLADIIIRLAPHAQDYLLE